nr:hypothetical protein GCM10020063_009470 [Dactylosporangium thailandense]
MRFGMTAEEAAAALPEARQLYRFEADPRSPEVVGLAMGWHSAQPAFYEYFLGSGQLFCVAADAVRGPLMSLNGAQLTGSDPPELQQWLLGVSESMDVALRFGPRTNPGIEELGLVLRVQRAADGVVTRPVLVGREWSERCVDDYESIIPESEWTGLLWPDERDPERAETWPAAGELPSWYGRWAPPF